MNAAASMTHEAALMEAYEEWQRLAEREGKGIRANNWPLVSDCQDRISALQTHIVRLTSSAREEWRLSGADRAQKEYNLRQTVSALMELETANSASLTAAKEITRAQLNQLHTARKNLKRVKRTYSSVGSAGLNSFS
jgi:hypothetical protein